MPSLEVAEKIASTLEVSMHVLVHSDKGELAEGSIDDCMLVGMFTKTQRLSEQSKQTVKALLPAFLLKKDLEQQLVG